MSREIEDFVDDILDDLSDKIQEFLEKKDKEYQDRAKLGVDISMGFNGYEAIIGGHSIHIEHDSSWHRWRFKDEDYKTFLELSEKKGEAVVQFLKELAKVLSPRSTAAGEENIAQDHNDDSFGEKPQDPAAESEDSFEDEDEEVIQAMTDVEGW